MDFRQSKCADSVLAGAAIVFAVTDPADGGTDNRAADDREIGRGLGVAHAAAVFSGDDVQALVQAVFDAPVFAVGLQHLLGGKDRRRTGSEECYAGRFLRIVCPQVFSWFCVG